MTPIAPVEIMALVPAARAARVQKLVAPPSYRESLAR
jgi:hypothetical protein